MKWIASFLHVKVHGLSADTGILILRVGTSLMMLRHGWPKLITYQENAHDFYNFLGLGDPLSLAMTVFAEVFCSIFLLLGIGTRLILIPLLILVMVIIFVVKGNAPIGEKELGLLYLLPYVVLFITGPGKYSLDYWIQPKRQKER